MAGKTNRQRKFKKIRGTLRVAANTTQVNQEMFGPDNFNMNTARLLGMRLDVTTQHRSTATESDMETEFNVWIDREQYGMDTPSLAPNGTISIAEIHEDDILRKKIKTVSDWVDNKEYYLPKLNRILEDDDALTLSVDFSATESDCVAEFQWELYVMVMD